MSIRDLDEEALARRREPFPHAIGRTYPMPRTLAGWPSGMVYRAEVPILHPHRVAFEREVPPEHRRKHRPWRGGAVTSETVRDVP